MKKVFAVDDDPTIREMVKQILTAEGYDVTLAENGALGLQQLQNSEFAHGLDLILLDVMMPEMTGLEVLSAVKDGDLAPTVPVIMLTGEARTEDILTGYNKGADYYITKPFTRAQLLHGISLVSDGEDQ